MPGPIVLRAMLLTQPTTAVPTGRLVLEATGGTPDLTPLFVDIPGVTTGVVSMSSVAVSYTYDQSGIAPAAYAGTITDAAGTRLPFTFTILALPVPGCTDPAADNYNPGATQDDGSCAYTPPPRYAHFEFSPAQSLRFTQPGAAPTLDNTPFAQQRPLNLTNPGYCQLIQRADTVVVQWQSNYNGAHAVQLVPCAGGAAVLSVVPVRVVVGAGASAAFEAYARPDTRPGRTRVYFNDDALPVPFAPGARVTLANAGALSGTYPVTDVLEDPAAGVPYLLLSAAYPGGTQRIDLDLTTPYALQAFDTWQAVLPFAGVPAGCYQARVSALDTQFAPALAVSEPLDVATAHADTLEIVYRNFDNGFGLNYTAGLVNRLRVVGRFFERDNPTQKTTLRESTGKLTLVSAEMQRRLRLTVFQLPDWLHEKIAGATCHDFVRVAGLKVIGEEKYDYPPTPAYTLSNGTIWLEQEDFLGAGNRDDVGDVDGGSFLLVNTDYLAINP